MSDKEICVLLIRFYLALTDNILPTWNDALLTDRVWRPWLKGRISRAVFWAAIIQFEAEEKENLIKEVGDEVGA